MPKAEVDARLGHWWVAETHVGPDTAHVGWSCGERNQLVFAWCIVVVKEQGLCPVSSEWFVVTLSERGHKRTARQGVAHWSKSSRDMPADGIKPIVVTVAALDSRPSLFGVSGNIVAGV